MLSHEHYLLRCGLLGFNEGISMNHEIYVSGISRLLANIKFKIAVLLFTATSIIVFFIIPLSYFNTDDVVPKLETVDIEKLEKFQTRYFSVKVDTGLYIKNFSIFHPIKDEFVMDGIVWFQFNSNTLMPDIVEKFSFDNGKILYKSPPDIRKFGNKIFVKYDVRVSFKSNLMYKKFPFNDHRVTLVLTNNFVAPEEMYFQVNESAFVVSPEIVLHDWIIRDLNVEAGYMNFELDKVDKKKEAAHPKALFTLNVTKASIRRILIIFIPLFVAAFFALLSFLMGMGNIRGRFSITITAVTALLGYRFVIERMMPPVGYFTTTDEIYTLLLIFAFFCLLFQLVVTRRYVRLKPDGMEARRLTFINDIIFLFSVFVLLITSGYFLIW